MKVKSELISFSILIISKVQAKKKSNGQKFNGALNSQKAIKIKNASLLVDTSGMSLFLLMHGAGGGSLSTSFREENMPMESTPR